MTNPEKKEISPAIAIGAIVAIVALVGGVGWWFLSNQNRATVPSQQVGSQMDDMRTQMQQQMQRMQPGAGGAGAPGAPMMGGQGSPTTSPGAPMVGGQGDAVPANQPNGSR